MKLSDDLLAYKTYNEQEETDRRVMLLFLETQTDCLSRNNLTAHFTASSWVVNKDQSKVLMIYHNLYNSWSWTGGHADGQEDLCAVAIREVKEETGVTHIKLLKDGIFSVETLVVEGHEKKGRYVPSHLHLNVTFLLQADETESLLIKPDENSGVAWFTPAGAIAASSELWMKERIYTKLNEKLLLEKALKEMKNPG